MPRPLLEDLSPFFVRMELLTNRKLFWTSGLVSSCLDAHWLPSPKLSHFFRCRKWQRRRCQVTVTARMVNILFAEYSLHTNQSNLDVMGFGRRWKWVSSGTLFGQLFSAFVRGCPGCLVTHEAFLVEKWVFWLLLVLAFFVLSDYSLFVFLTFLTFFCICYVFIHPFFPSTSL